MNPFEYNPAPNQAMLDAMAEVRDAISKAYTVMLQNIEPSRELALAVTSLEQAAMWANKGITHNPGAYNPMRQSALEASPQKAIG